MSRHVTSVVVVLLVLASILVSSKKVQQYQNQSQFDGSHQIEDKNDINYSQSVLAENNTVQVQEKWKITTGTANKGTSENAGTTGTIDPVTDGAPPVCNISDVYSVVLDPQKTHYNHSHFLFFRIGKFNMDIYNASILGKMNHAFCEYSYLGNAQQMAHGAQQLYRFLAWWLDDHPTKPRILWLRRPLKSPYLLNMVETFRQVLQVEVVTGGRPDVPPFPFDTQVPRVQAILDRTTLTNHTVPFTFGNPAVAHTFRTKVMAHYFPDKPTLQQQASSLPVVGILNRAKDRVLLNVNDLARRMDQELNGLATLYPSIEYFENKTFVEQLEFMSSVDILVTPHGAQLVNLPFLRAPCGTVLELFQVGYFIPHYFGSLAAGSGVQYSYLYTGANRTMELAHANRNPRRRKVARRSDFCASVDRIIEGLRTTVIDQWHVCRQKHQQQLQQENAGLS